MLRRGCWAKVKPAPWLQDLSEPWRHPRRRISWAFCGQVFQAYVTLNLSTSWDPSVLWNTVWEPLREFRAQGKRLRQLLEDKGP